MNTTRIYIVICATLSLICGIGTRAVAQDIPASFSGRVVDEKGLAVADVTVFIHDTCRVWSATAGTDGRFIIPSLQPEYPLLQPGHYGLLIWADGCKCYRSVVILVPGHNAGNNLVVVHEDRHGMIYRRSSQCTMVDDADSEAPAPQAFDGKARIR